MKYRIVDSEDFELSIKTDSATAAASEYGQTILRSKDVKSPMAIKVYDEDGVEKLFLVSFAVEIYVLEEEVSVEQEGPDSIQIEDGPLLDGKFDFYTSVQ